MIKDTFSTFEVLKALNLKRGRLREWMDRGFIKPSHPSSGQGKKALFTRIDVYCVALLDSLISKGFKRENAGKLVKGFLAYHPHKWDYDRITYIIFTMDVENGKDVILPFSFQKGWVEGAPFSFLKTFEDYEHGHIVNFEKIRTKVDLQLSLID